MKNIEEERGGWKGTNRRGAFATGEMDGRLPRVAKDSSQLGVSLEDQSNAVLAACGCPVKRGHAEGIAVGWVDAGKRQQKIDNVIKSLAS